MPNILILGATGYLGQALGLALLRTGNYTVYGTARSAEKAKQLVQQEITPVEGEATDPKFLSQAIATHHIDVVIDVTQAYGDATAILQTVVDAAKARAAALAKESAVGPKLGFVYTSGSWVHGSPGRRQRVSDLHVPGVSSHPSTPATAVGWRPGHEQAVLAAREYLDVAVLRPSHIYGRSSWVLGTLWGPLLGAAKQSTEEAVKISADEGAVTGLVHVDDLAAAYVAAVGGLGRLGSWPVFDIVTETLPVTTLVSAAAAELGVTSKIEYTGTGGNAFLEALSLVSNSDSARARTVLAWQPKRTNFVQNIAVYVAAWKSAQ